MIAGWSCLVPWHPLVMTNITVEKPVGRLWFHGILRDLPSGNKTHNYGRINHFRWLNPLSMAMFNSYVKLPEGMCPWLQNPINLTTSTMCTWCQLRHTSTISATVMLMISPGEKIPQCGTELGGPYGWHSEYRFPQWIIVILVLTVSRIAYRTI